MNANTPLEINDIVQLNPQCNNRVFAGCFMVITDVKSFGAQGYVQCTGESFNPGEKAYYRARWEEMEYAGKAVFVLT